MPTDAHVYATCLHVTCNVTCSSPTRHLHVARRTLVDYLEWISDLPWNRSSVDSLSIPEAKAKLEQDHFGVEKVRGL